MLNLFILAEGSSIPGYILVGVLAIVVGIILAWLGMGAIGKNQIKEAELKSKGIIKDAELQAENKIKTAQLEGKAEQIKMREEFERETAKVRNELRDTEKHLSKKEDSVDRKWESLNSKEKNLDKRENKLGQREKEIQSKDDQLNTVLQQQRAELLKISGISVDQAKEMLLERLESDVTHEASAMIENIVGRAKDEAESRSREITLNAIQRYAASHTCDYTVSTVDIPSDDMKGRVIGREGRNIRAFEKATGVDVIIDDTPGVVVVSAFDPVRREIARLSLEKLIVDGRIHPARIEEIVNETAKEMDNKLMELGKSAALEVNINGLPNKLMPYLGRLHFRTSYGQNVLKHSIEVAFLSQAMAEEVGLDGNLARRCGFLHDIGKAVDHEIEGGHPEIGADLLKKFRECEEVLNAVAGHHGDVPATSAYTPLVAAADAMSASRPGARRETLERYIKRLESLEEIANKFEGVNSSYAIQAGREIRVIVDPEKVDDGTAWKIARDIAAQVENELTYPGEVRITLLREVRCIEYAR